MKKVYIPCLALLICACGEIGNSVKENTAAHGYTPGIEASRHARLTAQIYLSPEEGIGHRQSPINIISRKAKDSNHNILLHYEDSKEVLKNLGHTVQLMYDEGSYIQMDQRRFDLKQLHFHTPAEHLVDGITYPMELHMVHVFHDNEKAEATPEYLVVGVLFKEGAENPFLAEFIESIPEQEGQTVEFANQHINVNNLIKDHFDGFYQYMGSLTTEPYTESVNWLVLKWVFEASPEQIEKLNKLEGNNARHIQALHDRTVEEVMH